jgi:hypothetical protein
VERENEGQVAEACDHVAGDGQHRGWHGPRLERDPVQTAAFAPVQNKVAHTSRLLRFIGGFL